MFPPFTPRSGKDSEHGPDDLGSSSNFFAQGDDFIVVENRCHTRHLVSRANMLAYLKYSQEVRCTIYAERVGPQPIGYNLVAHTFNQEPGVRSRFSTFDGEGRCVPGLFPEPDPFTFFGENVPASPADTRASRRATDMMEVLARESVARRRRVEQAIEERRGRRETGIKGLTSYRSRNRGRGRGSIGGQGEVQSTAPYARLRPVKIREEGTVTGALGTTEQEQPVEEVRGTTVDKGQAGGGDVGMDRG